MIHYFALDPSLARDFHSFRFCVDHCQPGKGRVIADLPPGEWIKSCLDEINTAVRERILQPVKAESLKKRLKRLRNRTCERPGSGWDYSDNWLTDTLVEHDREHFSAVLSPGISAGFPDKCYHPDEVDDECVDWETPNGTSITRSSGAFVDAVYPLLQAAKEIHLIDRGFSVDGDRMYLANLRILIERLARAESLFPSLTFHFCPDAQLSPSYVRYVENELNHNLKALLPRGVGLQFFLWRTDGNWVEKGAHPMHNRYVLTNICGLDVGYGLDSAQVQTDVEDHLQILDATVYLRLWKRARGEELFPGLEVGEKIVISGV